MYIRERGGGVESLHAGWWRRLSVRQTLAMIRNLRGGTYSLDVGPVNPKHAKKIRSLSVVSQLAFCAGKRIYEIDTQPSWLRKKEKNFFLVIKYLNKSPFYFSSFLVRPDEGKEIFINFITQLRNERERERKVIIYISLSATLVLLVFFAILFVRSFFLMEISRRFEGGRKRNVVIRTSKSMLRCIVTCFFFFFFILIQVCLLQFFR